MSGGNLDLTGTKAGSLRSAFDESPAIANFPIPMALIASLGLLSLG
jgi:hypothetical protein